MRTVRLNWWHRDIQCPYRYITMSVSFKEYLRASRWIYAISHWLPHRLSHIHSPQISHRLHQISRRSLKDTPQISHRLSHWLSHRLLHRFSHRLSHRLSHRFSHRLSLCRLSLRRLTLRFYLRSRADLAQISRRSRAEPPQISHWLHQNPLDLPQISHRSLTDSLADLAQISHRLPRRSRTDLSQTPSHRQNPSDLP